MAFHVDLDDQTVAFDVEIVQFVAPDLLASARVLEVTRMDTKDARGGAGDELQLARFVRQRHSLDLGFSAGKRLPQSGACVRIGLKRIDLNTWID